jgi:hypothetical protein
MKGLLFDDKQDQFIAPFGTLPRLKASNGNVLDSEDKLLGSYVDVQVVSWNNIWVISPNDPKAPVELVRYSYDNQTFDEDPSVTVGDYLAEMKQAWPNAASKQYAEVIAILHGAEKATELLGKMVQLQLSPTSRTAFEGFRLQAAFQIASGTASAEQSDMVRFNVNVVSSRGNSWSKFAPDFSPVS